MTDAPRSSFEQQVRSSRELFETDPQRARHVLRDLLAADPEAFRAAIVPVLRPPVPAAFRDGVKDLLARAGLLPLCEPSVFSLEEELEIVRALAREDPLLDLKLARRFSASSVPMPDEAALRLIDLLGEVCTGNRALPLIVRLLHDPNPRLQSKAAGLIARSNMAPKTAERLLAERDPRVRANAIEALWGSDSALARGLFREASRDGNNRVAGNALVGLYLLGDTSAIPQILKMAAHPDPLFRSTAAWVMARTGNPRFLPVLQGLVRDSRPGSRNRVFQAITTLKRAAARLAESPGLRVHLLSASGQSDGLRTLQAAIAGANGEIVDGLPPTGVVISEDSRLIVHYSVRGLPVPERIALGLYFPEGEPGDGIVAALTALKRERDRWSVVRHHATSVLPLLHQAFGSLGAISLPRHVLLDAGQPVTPAAVESDIAPIVRLARAGRVVIHSVAAPGEEGGEGCHLAQGTGGVVIRADTRAEVVQAYEKLYLGLLRPYEISYQSPTGTVLPSEIKLEIFGSAGHGASVLHPLALAGMAS